MNTHDSCPTDVVHAPIEVVWSLLTNAGGWGAFFKVRIRSVMPEGPAVVGQVVTAGPRHRVFGCRVVFRFVAIDALHHRLTIHVAMPLGIKVNEEMSCTRLAEDRCRVNYGCHFSFSEGWRGRAVRFLLRRRLQDGPEDSLARLRRMAERVHAAASTQ